MATRCCTFYHPDLDALICRDCDTTILKNSVESETFDGICQDCQKNYDPGIDI